MNSFKYIKKKKKIFYTKEDFAYPDKIRKEILYLKIKASLNKFCHFLSKY